MKKLLTIISFFISLIFSQEISSMNAWENILQTPELVKYFDAMGHSDPLTLEARGRLSSLLFA